LLTFFFAFASKGGAQTATEPIYHFNLYLGVGPQKYFNDMDYDNLNDDRPAVFTARLMWQPEHILRIGLESGYLPLYYLETKFYDTVYGDTDAELSLNSVPIIAVFAMEVYDNFEIFGGIGGFILISRVSSFGNTVGSTSWSNAYELGMNYLYPVSEKLKIGGELKSYYILRLENFDLVFNVMFRYTLFSY